MDCEMWCYSDNDKLRVSREGVKFQVRAVSRKGIVTINTSYHKLKQFHKRLGEVLEDFEKRKE